MSELLTVASLPRQAGLMMRGRLTRAEMIARLRAYASYQKESAEAILNARDEDFDVRIVRGVHVQHLVEKLK